MKLICVTGPDGSGKTTQIGRLAERLERRGKKKVAPVTIWDPLIDPQSKGRVPFESPQQVDDYLSILKPTSRALFLYHCFHQALELSKRRAADVYLLNAYWYKYYACEVAHGGDPATLQRLAEVFPEPAVTFHLRIEPAEAAKRKVRLSGYETGFASPRTKEAFVEFQHRAHRAMNDLAAQRGWVELNGTESIDALTDTLLSKIEC